MKSRLISRVQMLLIASCIFITTFSNVSLAQNVRVTIDMTDVRMETVMDAIEEQTSYLFTVDEDVNLELRVSVKVNDAPLSSALDQMVKGTDLAWRLNEKRTIILARQSAPQSRSVSGMVIDQSGLAVPGVSVYIKGTDIGTVTDLDGKFSLEVPGENLGGQLEFNSLGYGIVTVLIGLCIITRN